jgi:hypothetical protein
MAKLFHMLGEMCEQMQFDEVEIRLFLNQGFNLGLDPSLVLIATIVS